MKFLVFTDLHQKASVIDKINDMAARKGAEFAVCLGDVTDFGTPEDAADILSKINTKVYAIPGNCDPLDFAAGISNVAIDMHGNAAEVGGYRLVGLGGSNVTIFGTPFELEEDDLYDGLEGNCEEGMILMTHAPSYGILDQIPSGQSVGSPAIREIVDKYHPILAMSGHIHEAFGVVVSNGTTFLNPGPAKDGRMAIVTIEDGKVSVEMIGPADH
ncbi:MAG: metallophosphoesterase [Thermoplasmata archaeon]|nr:metallophosphoesterase [Thermoplasmata archaeon]